MGQANGGEMRQSEGVQAPTLSATGVSTVPDARTGGRVEAVFGWQGEHSGNVDGGPGGLPSILPSDGRPGGLLAQPDTDCGTHTEANGGAGVQPAAATKDTGGDVSAAASGASVLRNQPGPAIRDGSDESDVDAHSAEELRVAVHAILTEAGAESVAMEEKEGCRRRARAITETATRRLQEVMKQAEVVEHRGAAAEAGEAEMEAAEPRVGQETEVPVTMEVEATVLTEAELLAQMAADEAETDTEAKKTGETVPWFVQKPTRRQAAPEIGPPNVWARIVPKRGYTQVRCVATGAPLEPRRLTLSEMESLASGSPRHSGFPMRAVPARAAGFGYSRESDYNKLTRRQRDTATQFTHQFEVVDISQHTPPVVGVTTQPKGTGRAQGVEQVGSSGVPRGTTDGGEVHPFNQAALQMRSAERSRKAKAENELARQRRRGYGSSTDEELYGSSTDEELYGSSTDSTATTYQHTMSLPGGSDVRQGLRRGAATWAMKEVGQDPDEEFNGSPAQQMVQEQVESDAAEADETDDRGIGGRGLVWWFNSWQHWQEDKDRKLSGCTDFDAMYFARTQRVCLGGAWGCVLAWMQETTCDTRAVKMLRSTFRLASATRGRRTRTPGVTLFSGADAQQMAGNMSHSGSGAGSGTGGRAAKQTESATMGRPAPGEEAAAEQHGNGDNTSAVRRVMNRTELGLARSQAVLIMHKLMSRLTNLVTNSLGSDNGSEEVAMIAGEPEEHHRMLVTVRDQAAGLARSEFQRISFGTPGIGLEARQPGEGRRQDRLGPRGQSRWRW